MKNNIQIPFGDRIRTVPEPHILKSGNGILRLILLFLFSFMFLVSCNIKETPGKLRSMHSVPEESKSRERPHSATGESYYHYIESQLQLRNGNPYRSRKHLEQALQEDPDSTFLAMELANLYFSMKNDEIAMDLIRNLVATHEDDPEVLLYFGKLLQNRKDTKAAAEAYEKILSMDPSNKDVYLFLGMMYSDEGNFDAALDVFKRMEENLPDSYLGSFNSANIYLKKKETENAERELKKALDLSNGSEEVRNELVLLYENQKRYKDLIAILEQVTDTNPDDIPSVFALGIAYKKAGMEKKAGTVFFDLGKKSASNDKVLQVLFQNYIRLEKYDDSILILEGMLAADPDASQLHYAMGLLYKQKNDSENAIDHFREVKPGSRFYDDAVAELVDLLRSGEQKTEAVRYLKELLKRDPKNLKYIIYLEDIYEKTGESQKAADMLHLAIEIDPRNAALRHRLGEVYLSMNNMDAALPQFKSVLDIERGMESDLFQSAVSFLTTVYRKTNKPEKAINLLETILKDNPDNTEIMGSLALFYEKSGRFKDAETLLKKSAELDPEDPKTLYQLGILYDKWGKKEQSVNTMKKLIALDPEPDYFRAAVMQISMIYRESGDMEKAISFSMKMLEKNPSDTELIKYVGLLFEEEGKYEQAIEILKKGIDIAPNDSTIYFRLGVVFDKSGNKEECIAYMRKVLSLDPKNASALNYIGYTYAEMGLNLDEAENLIKEALKYKPEDGYITDSLGWVFYKRGMFQEAVDILKKAVELVPEDPIILEHMGDAYLKIGQSGKAIEFFNKSLEKKNKDPEKLKQKIKTIIEGEK